MTCLLDTDVVSQLSKPLPHSAAYAWIQSQPDEDIFLSAVTMFELRFGVEELSPGKKRQAIEQFLESTMHQKFHGRILPVTSEIADAAGQIFSRALHARVGMDAADAMIAATALHHGMTLATLNRKHFEWIGMPLVAF